MAWNMTAEFIETCSGFDHRVGHLWALRMMSESSNAPFLRCFSAFASHRETNGVADAMIEADSHYLR